MQVIGRYISYSGKPRRSCQDMTKHKYNDFHFILAAQINMMTSPIKMSHNRNTTLKWCVFHLLRVLPDKDNIFATLHIKAAPFLSEHISKDAPVALSCEEAKGRMSTPGAPALLQT
jgi:hypothetical protein